MVCAREWWVCGWHRVGWMTWALIPRRNREREQERDREREVESSRLKEMQSIIGRQRTEEERSRREEDERRTVSKARLRHPFPAMTKHAPATLLSHQALEHKVREQERLMTDQLDKMRRDFSSLQTQLMQQAPPPLTPCALHLELRLPTPSLRQRSSFCRSLQLGLDSLPHVGSFGSRGLQLYRVVIGGDAI